MNYDLLAIDLDGTLLNQSGGVSLRNIQAVRRAVLVGLKVVVCTGRGHVEARAALEQIGLIGPHVFNTGAMVVDHPSTATVDRSVMETRLVRRLVERFWGNEYAVLLYRDRDACGHDYLVTGSGRMTANSRWWFDHVSAKVAHAPDLGGEAGGDEFFEHTVRVGMVGPHDQMLSHADTLMTEYAGQIEAHAFEAVLEQGSNQILSILEVFGAGINKWHGIQVACDRLDADPSRVVFIGDQINDLPALKNAALGIAVGNAVESARAAAGVVLEETNEQDAVAVAIERLIGAAVA